MPVLTTSLGKIECVSRTETGRKTETSMYLRVGLAWPVLFRRMLKMTGCRRSTRCWLQNLWRSFLIFSLYAASSSFSFSGVCEDFPAPTLANPLANPTKSKPQLIPNFISRLISRAKSTTMTMALRGIVNASRLNHITPHSHRKRGLFPLSCPRRILRVPTCSTKTPLNTHASDSLGCSNVDSRPPRPLPLTGRAPPGRFRLSERVIGPHCTH